MNLTSVDNGVFLIVKSSMRSFPSLLILSFSFYYYFIGFWTLGILIPVYLKYFGAGVIKMKVNYMKARYRTEVQFLFKRMLKSDLFIYYPPIVYLFLFFISFCDSFWSEQYPSVLENLIVENWFPVFNLSTHFLQLFCLFNMFLPSLEMNSVNFIYSWQNLLELYVCW